MFNIARLYFSHFLWGSYTDTIWSALSSGLYKRRGEGQESVGNNFLGNCHDHANIHSHFPNVADTHREHTGTLWICRMGVWNSLINTSSLGLGNVRVCLCACVHAALCVCVCTCVCNCRRNVAIQRSSPLQINIWWWQYWRYVKHEEGNFLVK